MSYGYTEDKHGHLVIVGPLGYVCDASSHSDARKLCAVLLQRDQAALLVKRAVDIAGLSFEEAFPLETAWLQEAREFLKDKVVPPCTH